MDQMEILKCKIEEERKKLDQMVLESDMEKSYEQSLILDKLIAQYLELTA